MMNGAHTSKHEISYAHDRKYQSIVCYYMQGNRSSAATVNVIHGKELVITSF